MIGWEALAVAYVCSVILWVIMLLAATVEWWVEQGERRRLKRRARRAFRNARVEVENLKVGVIRLGERFDEATQAARELK